MAWGHGLSPNEAAVMDLWDQGFTPGQIAVQLDVRPARVKQIITYYGGAEEAREERKMMTAGSALLAAAIAEARAG